MRFSMVRVVNFWSMTSPNSIPNTSYLKHYLPRYFGLTIISFLTNIPYLFPFCVVIRSFLLIMRFIRSSNNINIRNYDFPPKDLNEFWAIKNFWWNYSLMLPWNIAYDSLYPLQFSWEKHGLFGLVFFFCIMLSDAS